MENSASIDPTKVGTEPHGDSSQVKVMPLEATTEDVEGLLAVEAMAFKTDAMFETIFNRPGVVRPTKETRVQKHLTNMANPSFMYFKAVDPADGKIVGTASWYMASDPHAEGQNSPWGDPPEGTNIECFNAVVVKLRRWRMYHFRDINAPYAYLQMMSVLPSMQRRGIGTTLICAGLDEVDRRGWHSYVTASPKGLGLYKKLGWIEMTKTEVDLKERGGPDEVAVTVALVRPPATRGNDTGRHGQ